MSASLRKVSLVTGALVAAFLAASQLVLGALALAVAIGLNGGAADLVNAGTIPSFISATFAWLVHVALFGAGVFLSLGFIAPIAAANGWRQVILRGAAAAALGAAVLVVYATITSVVGNSSFGPHPFGYSFQPVVNTGSLGSGALDGLYSGVLAFVNWLPLVILAGILQRLWLAKHTAAVTGAVASAAVKP